ncbi:uncharacterized protein BDZ99DRAFT_150581 [Mytilinidion resinicola]|uniref:Uncharacterized protein n=1 Tax=Mytilinidion resinicola TaxID=574789 RepID=A0A6A6Y798_9PEZI|nr:uncharacterized protein BDZ99DRAFT_150581 [Mytilinidion resinicola]KAF2804696.1 hypothetical protein BDZ99DRAFT_150581 [Mytilinidion resinicola]
MYFKRPAIILGAIISLISVYPPHYLLHIERGIDSIFFTSRSKGPTLRSSFNRITRRIRSQNMLRRTSKGK